jgi:hypothetical protein
VRAKRDLAVEADVAEAIREAAKVRGRTSTPWAYGKVWDRVMLLVAVALFVAALLILAAIVVSAPMECALIAALLLAVGALSSRRGHSGIKVLARRKAC